MYRFYPPILRLTILFLVLCTVQLPVSAQKRTHDPDAIVGKWLSAQKRNQVQMYKVGDKYYGKIAWMLEPNDPVTGNLKLDPRNPDENLRSRSIMNAVLVKGLEYKGKNVWGGGEIYNPEDGKTYSCIVTLRDPNTLDLRGYMFGITLLGKTISWTRVR